MDDKTIKVSVLEGDLAMLSTLGFPLPLCIQLQLSCLRIDEAMWTARSSPGGFSVNLFWPAPAPEKNDVQHKKRRKRRRRRTKARSQVTISNTNPDVPATNLPVCDQSKSILPHESCMRAQKPAENPAVDLTACNDVNYEVREGVHGVTYHDKTGDQPNWTPVVAKRKKKQVPVSSFVRQRFAPGHPIHQRDATSDSDSDSGSDVDLNNIIPSKSANVQYNEVDGTPGLSIWTNKTRSWTPIAARTRARLKQ